MSRLVKLTVFSLSILVISYVGLGFLLGKTDDDRSYRSLTVYSEVLQHIQQDYVEEPNLQLVTSGALHGLLESLDPLSSYLTPREYADYKQKMQNGTKGEIGAVLSKRFGYIMLVAVLPDSPAQKAGLRGGDILEAIAGFTTREMSVGQANILLAGQPGTSVKLSLVRRGRAEPQELELIRAQLAPAPLVSEKLDADIAYLRVPTLETDRANQIREKLLQFDRQGMRKLVLDLRDCARGETSEAVAVARLFLNSGTITSLRGQTVTHQDLTAEPSKVVWKHPVNVLISNSTTGAVEILAAAIGGNQRGELVGQRTYGSASEQKLIPLEDGAALVLTVAKYYTPAGKPIPEEGVAPTREVRTARDDQDDDDFSGATPRPSITDDPVVRRAIELLKEGRKAA